MPWRYVALGNYRCVSITLDEYDLVALPRWRKVTSKRPILLATIPLFSANAHFPAPVFLRDLRYLAFAFWLFREIFVRPHYCVPFDVCIRQNYDLPSFCSSIDWDKEFWGRTHPRNFWVVGVAPEEEVLQ